MTHKSIEWLEARQSGIGGSDAAAILGVNPFMTVQELYEDKTTEIRNDRELTGPMKRGIVLEPIAADYYVEETGRTIRKQDQKRHPDLDFMIGNVDREIIEGINVDSRIAAASDPPIPLCLASSHSIDLWVMPSP